MKKDRVMQMATELKLPQGVAVHVTVTPRGLNIR
jgi:hypothetical protein